MESRCGLTNTALVVEERDPLCHSHSPYSGSRLDELRITAYIARIAYSVNQTVAHTTGERCQVFFGFPSCSLDIMTSDGGKLTPDGTRVSFPETRAA